MALKLLEPLHIGSMELKNRMVLAPMGVTVGNMTADTVDYFVERAKGGAAMIAIRAGVRMQPVYIATEKRMFRKTKIVFGPAYAPAYTGRKGTAEEYQANVDEIMRQIKELGGQA